MILDIVLIGRDMHSIDQAESFFDPAFVDQRFNPGSDVDELPSFSRMKFKIFGQGFHLLLLVLILIPPPPSRRRIRDWTNVFH